jgi:hypothetical protein
LVCRAGKYAMSVTASPALITASCAAATNERPAGYRRNSEVWDKNTRRGGRSMGITHSIPARTQRENTHSPDRPGSPRHVLAAIAAVAASYRLGALARDTGA